MDDPLSRSFGMACQTVLARLLHALREKNVLTDREINNLAKALAEQTAWTLQTVDLLLIDTARWYQSESGSMPALKRCLNSRAALPLLV